MTPDQALEAAAVLTAFANGRKIQYRDEFTCGKWESITSPVWNWGLCEYRVAPEPSAQLFATLDPENGEEVPTCPECVQGYVQETGFDRCEKCNPKASGVEPRICGWMPIETAPRDGTRILGTWVSTWTDGAPHIEAIECGENGVWFYSYDGDGPPDHKPPTHWQPLPPPPAERSDYE